jgi:hypothetical protein
MRRFKLSTLALAMLALAGCIVGDELTTYTVQPDGVTDYVKFQSNIHSSEKGAKGAEELKTFVSEFDARTNSDYVRIAECGGSVTDARWVRREEPYATLVAARLPSAAALEQFFTFRDKGEVVAQGRFTSEGNRRRFSISARIPPDQRPPEKPLPSFKEWRKEQANDVSETRLVVPGGHILAAAGFVVANDKRSALLDMTEVEELVRKNGDRVEVFVEWQLGE